MKLTFNILDHSHYCRLYIGKYTLSCKIGAKRMKSLAQVPGGEAIIHLRPGKTCTHKTRFCLPLFFTSNLAISFSFVVYIYRIALKRQFSITYTKRNYTKPKHANKNKHLSANASRFPLNTKLKL